jgi:hypothetical protein
MPCAPLPAILWWLFEQWLGTCLWVGECVSSSCGDCLVNTLPQVLITTFELVLKDAAVLSKVRPCADCQ